MNGVYEPAIIKKIPAWSSLRSQGRRDAGAKLYAVEKLSVASYRALDEALAFVKARPRPLALYIFTNDGVIRRELLDGTISGGVTVNGALLHAAQDSLPFGGVGASGFGAYRGYDGFRRFSHARSVHVAGFVNPLERLGPPWGRASKAISAWLRSRR